MNVLVFTFVGLATIALTFFGVFYGTHKISSIWIMFASIVLYALAGCIYWQQQVAPDTEIRADSIRLKINGAFKADSDATSVLYVKYNTGTGSTLSPAPLAYGVSITNVGPRPVQLDSLSLSVKLGRWGSWHQLRSLPIMGAEVYWVGDHPKEAQLVKLSQIDDELSGKPIAPNTPVNGWMLFRYPPSLEDPKGSHVQMRFDAEDSASNRYEFLIPEADLQDTQKGSLKPNAPHMFFTGIKEDLTVYPIERSAPERE